MNTIDSIPSVRPSLREKLTPLTKGVAVAASVLALSGVAKFGSDAIADRCSGQTGFVCEVNGEIRDNVRVAGEMIGAVVAGVTGPESPDPENPTYPIFDPQAPPVGGVNYFASARVFLTSSATWRGVISALTMN